MNVDWCFIYRVILVFKWVQHTVRNWPRWGGEQTQLHYYCEKGMTSSVVRMLEMKSINVEAKGRYERTCLMTAVNNWHLAICRLLIDKGAEVEVKDRHGCSPLHLAAIQGHIEIVRLLCDRGADVEARDVDGLRPLHWAAYYGRFSVVKELIEERNADINARINGGSTALTLARQHYKHDIAAYLVSHGGIV